MADPRTVDIKVHLHPDREPKFHLECDELPKGPKANHYIFHNNEHPGFYVRFILQDPTHGYAFPDDTDEALYSAKGEECPNQKGQWGQFRADKNKSTNQMLVVRNMNQKGHEGEFGYTLRVTKTPHDDQAEYLDLDPGGTNGNGPSSPFTINYLAVAAVGLLTGIVGALATVFVLMRSNFLCQPGATGI